MGIVVGVGVGLVTGVGALIAAVTVPGVPSPVVSLGIYVNVSCPTKPRFAV